MNAPRSEASPSTARRSSADMRLLGVDPGLHLTGYAVLKLSPLPVLVEAGVIRLSGKATLPARLADLHEQIAAIIEEFAISHVGVEQLYAHYNHPRTAILMGHARGVILLAAGRLGIPVIDLPSTLVKKTFTGNGHATKSQMQRTAASRFKLSKPPSPPDVADAMAIAYVLGTRLIVPQRAIKR